MKNFKSKYILAGLMSLLFTVQMWAVPNPNVLGANVSPAPATFPGGTVTFQFQLNNDGTATSNAAVTVTVSLSQLDFAGSTFNVATDIAQTVGTTPFTWSYEPSTKVLTATLNGNFAQFAFNTFQIRNLKVQAASAMSNPTIGANVNVVTPTAINSNVNDDNTNAYTYTTATLPVELSAFEATTVNNCEAKLTWTASEMTNFGYFQVEQSVDGRNFTESGNAQKGGSYTSNYEQTVELKAAKSKYVYFRLKMVDADRSVKYSKIVSIQSDCAAKDNLLIVPNPASNVIRVKATDTHGSLLIYDMLGRLCLTLTATEFGNQDINVSSLTAGTYMVQLTSEQGVSYNKFVKR
jgi:hypothetical protein